MHRRLEVPGTGSSCNPESGIHLDADPSHGINHYRYWYRHAEAQQVQDVSNDHDHDKQDLKNIFLENLPDAINQELSPEPVELQRLKLS